MSLKVQMMWPICDRTHLVRLRCKASSATNVWAQILMWSSLWLQLSLLTYRQWWWMKRMQTVQRPPLKRLLLIPTLPLISEMLSLRPWPPPQSRTATLPNLLSKKSCLKRMKRRRRSLPKRPIWEVCSSSRCKWKSRRGSRRKKTRMRTVEVLTDDLSSKSHSLRNSITQLSVVNPTKTIKRKVRLSNLTLNRLERRTRIFSTVTKKSFKLTALS